VGAWPKKETFLVDAHKSGWTYVRKLEREREIDKERERERERERKREIEKERERYIL
jgi:hypothetical protein